MKYKPHIYAEAIKALALQKKIGGDAAKNLLRLLQKNGDLKRLPKIIELAEQKIRKARGIRKITIESARNLPGIKEKIRAAIGEPHDEIETKISPHLVAGIRITINDEDELDASLKHKLEKLFA